MDEKDKLTEGFKSFTADIEKEIDKRVAAACDPLETKIAELTERVLCLEQVHNMSPADYEQPDEDDD